MKDDSSLKDYGSLKDDGSLKDNGSLKDDGSVRLGRVHRTSCWDYFNCGDTSVICRQLLYHVSLTKARKIRQIVYIFKMFQLNSRIFPNVNGERRGELLSRVPARRL